MDFNYRNGSRKQHHKVPTTINKSRNNHPAIEYENKPLNTGHKHTIKYKKLRVIIPVNRTSKNSKKLAIIEL